MESLPPLSRAESKELNRRKLLSAARELMIECGYGALSARQVSARAGVAQSSFYAHFKDKEDLIKTLSEEIFSQLRRQLRDIRLSPGQASWDEILGLMMGRLYAFFLEERDLIALLFQELDQPDSPLNEIGQEIFETLHRDLEEDLERFQLMGRLPRNLPVDATVTLVIGTCTYILRRILQGRVRDPMALFMEFGALNQAMLRGLVSAADAS